MWSREILIIALSWWMVKHLSWSKTLKVPECNDCSSLLKEDKCTYKRWHGTDTVINCFKCNRNVRMEVGCLRQDLYQSYEVLVWQEGEVKHTNGKITKLPSVYNDGNSFLNQKHWRFRRLWYTFPLSITPIKWKEWASGRSRLAKI